jgi:hypothetical protein
VIPVLPGLPEKQGLRVLKAPQDRSARPDPKDLQASAKPGLPGLLALPAPQDLKALQAPLARLDHWARRVLLVLQVRQVQRAYKVQQDQKALLARRA